MLNPNVAVSGNHINLNYNYTADTIKSVLYDYISITEAVVNRHHAIFNGHPLYQNGYYDLLYFDVTNHQHPIREVRHLTPNQLELFVKYNSVQDYLKILMGSKRFLQLINHHQWLTVDNNGVFSVKDAIYIHHFLKNYINLAQEIQLISKTRLGYYQETQRIIKHAIKGYRLQKASKNYHQ